MHNKTISPKQIKSIKFNFNYFKQIITINLGCITKIFLFFNILFFTCNYLTDLFNKILMNF